MDCRGLHCDGCSHHGGIGFGAGFGALLLLGGVLVYAGHRHAIDHTADVAVHVALTVLTVAAISIGALAAAGVGVVVTRAAVAVRAHRRAIAPPRVVVLPGQEPGAGTACGGGIGSAGADVAVARLAGGHRPAGRQEVRR